MFDTNLKPHLLDLSEMPPMNSEETVEMNIKRPLLADALKLLNLNVPRKLIYREEEEERMYEQLVKATK